MKKTKVNIQEHRKNCKALPMRVLSWMLAAVFLPVMLAGAAGGLAVYASQDGSDGAQDDDGLVIEVVGEHSIDDEVIIEDEEVPLGMFSEGPADPGLRHAVTMGIVFCCAVGYALYFRRYDEKLFALRREAALAEKQMMDRRPGNDPGKDPLGGPDGEPAA